MAKKYIVDLNEAEKEALVELTNKGNPGARKIKRANILLLADSSKTDFEIAAPKAVTLAARSSLRVHPKISAAQRGRIRVNSCRSMCRQHTSRICV